MSVWAWLKLTVALWLIRKAVKITGWLLLAAIAAAAWPVTIVGVAGDLAAWLRGWPPVRLYRTAAWALPMAAVWLGALEVRTPGWVAARSPGRVWAAGWDHLDADLARAAAAAARPRSDRRRAVAGGGAADPGAGRRACRHHRAGHLIPAHRPPRPGPSARTVARRADWGFRAAGAAGCRRWFSSRSSR